MTKKKVVLFPEISQVKAFLSLTRPRSRMFIRIYIFNFRKQTNKRKVRMQIKQSKLKKKREYLRKIDQKK